MSGEQEDLVGETSAGGQEGVQLSGVLELVQATEGAEDALLGLAAVPEVLDELAVAAGPRRFDAAEPGDLAKKGTP
jgi:hypothetical protein